MVDAILEPIRTDCMVCHVRISGPAESKRVSHGICPDCLPAYRVSCGLPPKQSAA